MNPALLADGPPCTRDRGSRARGPLRGPGRRALRWRWVRSPLLRLAHLGIMLYIALNALRNELCFLTRVRPPPRGRPAGCGGLVRGAGAPRILFVDVDQALLNGIYLGFFGLVVLTLVLVRLADGMIEAADHNPGADRATRPKPPPAAAAAGPPEPAHPADTGGPRQVEEAVLEALLHPAVAAREAGRGSRRSSTSRPRWRAEGERVWGAPSPEPALRAGRVGGGVRVAVHRPHHRGWGAGAPGARILETSLRPENSVRVGAYPSS